MLPHSANYLTVYSLIVISFILVQDVVQAFKAKNKRIRLWRTVFLIPTFVFLVNLI